MFGSALIIARSSRAICEAPSSPIDTPACDPAILTLTPLIAAMRMKSAARERKVAKVDGNGMAPRLASPIAAPIITCSAMKHLVEALGVPGLEALAEGGVLDVGVERDDARIDVAELGERGAVGLASGDQVAQRVRRRRHRRAGARLGRRRVRGSGNRRALPRRRRPVARRARRWPWPARRPSSAPCRASWACRPGS